MPEAAQKRRHENTQERSLWKGDADADPRRNAGASLGGKEDSRTQV